MNLQARYKVDISQPVQPTPLMQMLICQDSQANRFIVDVYDGDDPVALTGSCVGYAVRADGATVPMTGTVSGGSLAVVLPEEAYAVEGPVNIVIKNVAGDVRTTVFFGMGTVIIGQTGTVVNPGDVIPDLAALLAAIDQMEQATAAANAAAASAQRYTGGVSLSFELGDFYVDAGGTGTYYNSTIRMRTPQGTTVALKAGDVAQFVDPTGRQFIIYAKNAATGLYTGISGGWISGPFTVPSDTEAVILLRYVGEPTISDPDDLSAGFQIWRADSDHLRFSERFADVEEEINDLRNSAIFYRDADGYVCEY